MSLLSGLVVVASGLFLVGLAVVVVVRPALAERFLASFASSARAHYMEQGLRLLAGAAMVRFAPQMAFPDVFRIFGWFLALSAAVLLLMPWRWHHRLGVWAIPLATRNLGLVAVGALALGGFILYGASRAVLP